MNIPEMPFRAPVDIRLPNGLEHSFRSVYDALDFLENEWPLKHGAGYDRAVHKCRAVLKQLAPVELARETFITACLEAAMPIVGTGMPAPPSHARSPVASAARKFAPHTISATLDFGDG